MGDKLDKLMKSSLKRAESNIKLAKHFNSVVEQATKDLKRIEKFLKK
tara:strand:- start:788 stop:928 length:141 start_codon:yes stop_codon:yes gene_type:complete